MRLICVSLVCMAGLLDLTLQIPSSLAQTWSFDTTQLYEGAEHADITVLEQGGQLPGIYLVDILLNGRHVDSREVNFYLEKNSHGDMTLKSCLTQSMLLHYGIKIRDYPALFKKNNEDSDSASQCADIPAIPQATETFLFNNQQLILSIPQIALQSTSQGIAPQELWEDGMPALLMNYQLQVNHYEISGDTGAPKNTYVFARFTPGLNLGAWRLRNASTWHKKRRDAGEWQSDYTYAERGLYRLKSRLTLGESYTPSDIFDSVPFRGGMVASDEDMVPYNQRDFAPVVRGVARTLARIEVRQSGILVYSDMVAPGPFALTDLSVNGGSGDLLVTVFETDGKRQEFTVPYTTPAIALRERYLKYNLTAGQYPPYSSSVRRVPVAQLTAMYGLPWGHLTPYGGFQWSEHYNAAALGGGVSLGSLGALSMDVTHSEGRKQSGKNMRGQSWRIRFVREFDLTHTRISLSRTHFSSAFTTLSQLQNTYQHNSHKMNDIWGEYCADRLKSRTTVVLSQSLSRWGSINLSGTQTTYQGNTPDGIEFTASYGSTFRELSWSLDWSRRRERHASGQQINLWFSLPISSSAGGNSYASYNMRTSSQRKTQHELGLNGSTYNDRFRWDFRERFTPYSSGNNSDSQLNLSWRGTYGDLSAGYGYSQASRQINVGLNGGMVIHPHGVTFGQPLGQTVALVEAPGVAGAAVAGRAGVRTDFRGYTTVGYVRPYQENVISLDPATLPQDAELPQTDLRVVPTAGALIPVKFNPRIGGRAVITLRRPDTHPVPFGAMARLTGAEINYVVSGIVGDAGELYMNGLPKKGMLIVDWGAGRQCKACYQLTEEHKSAGTYILDAICR